MLAILSTHPIQYQVPLWQALAKSGSVPFEVWYLTDHGVKPSHDPQFGKSFAWDLDVLSGYPHRFLKVNSDNHVSSFSKLRLRERLQPLFREHNVSALWVQGWQVLAYWQAIRQAHTAGLPVWLRGETNDLASVSTWKKPLKHLTLRQLFSRVEEFLYIGEANRRFYLKLGIKADRLHAAPYCVDNERFAAQAEELRSQRTNIRRAWNIPDDAFCVLFAAKFIDKKRPFDLVSAFQDPRLAKQGRPIHILFVGSGELGDSLRGACQVVFDAESVTTTPAPVNREAPPASFAGFLNQKEISKAYVAADCLVLPSDHRETWGLVVNEAMASGLPCIVSDACGCAEDLVAPINPRARYPMGETAALARAISEMMSRPPSIQALRNQVNKFNLDVTVNTVNQLFYSTDHSVVQSPVPAILTQ
ncbi:MAG: glycosyltransferase family 4 protein [Acidobacteriota bacterium]|nr:glycosyltransferase family 4 protein [Acidobacteriota bacterium]